MVAAASLVERAAAVAQPWADLFADHNALSTSVITAHILSMFVAGGMAIGADRTILRSKPGTADAVRAVVADLSTTHSVVIGGLTCVVVTGLSLFASDVKTFAVSRVFWIKMACLIVLLLNGIRMQRAETQVMGTLEGVPIRTTEMRVPFPKQEWGAIRRAAGTSLLMWCAIVILGVVLTNG